MNKLLRFWAICIIGVAFATSSIAWAQTIITFDAPGAGTLPGQGTIASSINPAGEITGWYDDASDVVHGFLRSR